MTDNNNLTDTLDIYNKKTMVQMKAPTVKDRSPNPIQITAEQIIKDPSLHQMDDIKLPINPIMDYNEQEDYKRIKRTEYEDKLRRQKHHIGNWVKYALWEERLGEFPRARSIFERALNIDYKNVSLILKYAEMEMGHKFINHARNVWERATLWLPRVDQFWFKYIYMEEMLGQYIKARQIFEKWMSWKPGEKSWMAFMKFEERLGEFENARKVMYRYLDCHPKLETYLKVAKYEVKLKNFNDARFIYEKALHDLGEQAFKENFFIQWAKFELRSGELKRAREVFKFGMDNLPKEETQRLYEEHLRMEKQHGDRHVVDDLVLEKRAKYYKNILDNNPTNYDIWIDLLLLELKRKEYVRIRETFENAVKNTPPSKTEKRFWKRYIYIWILYCTFEEIDAKDIERTKQVYERVLTIIPHSEFTFSKIWIMYSHFYIRCKDQDMARRVYGNAIGKCPKDKIFKAYIQLEMQLGNFDRCRKIYEKYLDVFPDNPLPWIGYAELECVLEEYSRARSLFESAIKLPALNMPETIWKAYIDMEISLEEINNARELYAKLQEKTKHIKVWVSIVDFEFEHGKVDFMRDVFTRGDEYFRQGEDLKEERKMLLDKWLQIERDLAITDMDDDKIWVGKVEAKMPRIVKKQRRVRIENEEGEDEEEQVSGWEQYIEYIFPDDPSNFKEPKLIRKAKEWSKLIEQKKIDTTKEPEVAE